MTDFNIHAAVQSLMKQGISQTRAKRLVHLIIESRQTNDYIKPNFEAKLSTIRKQLIIWYICFAICVTALLVAAHMIFTKFSH